VGSQGDHRLLDSAVALGDLPTIELIGIEILLEREQVFGAIVAGERRDQRKSTDGRVVVNS